MNLVELWESVHQAAKNNRRTELIELLRLLSSEDEKLGKQVAKVLCDRIMSLGNNPSDKDVRKQCEVIEAAAGGATLFHSVDTRSFRKRA
jgi:hypothetical protein